MKLSPDPSIRKILLWSTAVYCTLLVVVILWAIATDIW